jgi:hypothetical protein
MSPTMCKTPLKVGGIGALCALLLAGCANPWWDKKPAYNPNAPKVTRAKPVTDTGRKAVVLSLHMRKAYPNACMLGITVTNNLDERVMNISVRLGATIRGDVVYDAIARNFTNLRPTESQYREVTYTNIRCEEIDHITVTDPGRCAIGEVNRFTAAPGDCAKFIDVPSSPLMDMRKGS